MANLKKQGEEVPLVKQEITRAPESMPEQVSVAEVAQEQMETQTSVERMDERGQEEQGINDTATVVTQDTTPKPTPVVTKDALAEQIEDVLEEDMTDMFLSMSPEDRQKFKVKGEETVSKIRQLLEHTKLQTKKIFNLIRSWLSLIPGVNRFFLEQEAKIKTDKIKQLSDEQRNNSL